MILTREKILEYLKDEIITIENFKLENLGPVSYDLTISDEVRFISSKLKSEFIETSNPKVTGVISKLPVVLMHLDAMIFSSEEYIKVPSFISGIVYARSSLTKLPLLFNIPGLVDPGYEGNITGVAYNITKSSINIKKMRICQVVFHEHSIVKEHYGKRKSSKNQGQKGVESLKSRTDIEFR